MKIIFYTVALSLVVVAARAQVYVDSVMLGAGFTNDIYYNLPNHAKTNTAANDWDVAFSTQHAQPPLHVAQSVTVRINGGHGAEVYKLADTSAFSNVFTSTDSATWQRLFDSPTDWDNGALNTTANASSNYDFGWGLYDINTHNVNADSIYAVRTVSGAWKKLWIKELKYDSTWYVTVANLDNTGLTNMQISKNAAPNKNFMYVALATASVMDKEPVDWDLLFTHYTDYITPPGIHYNVTGVLQNKNVLVSKAYPVDVNTVTYGPFGNMSANINTIGYDWKTYDFGTNQYVLEDSLVYFVKARDNAIYKLRFTGFDATNTKINFETGFVQGLDVQLVKNNSGIVLYPNPSSQTLAVVNIQSNASNYRIMNACGQQIAAGRFASGALVNTVDVSLLASGMYVIQLIDDTSVRSQSFVVQR